MIDHVLGFGLRQPGMKQGATAALGKCFAAGATAQQAEAIMAVDLANRQVALAGLTTLVAFGIHPGSSRQVGSFHEVLLYWLIPMF